MSKPLNLRRLRARRFNALRNAPSPHWSVEQFEAYSRELQPKLLAKFHVALGEIQGEYTAEGNTPEEAVRNLIEAVANNPPRKMYR